MIATLLIDSTLMPSVYILLGAGLLATVLGVFFLNKSRMLRRAMPEELTATVFDKTFNVFDVFPPHGKTLLNYTVPLFGICVYGTIVVGSFVIMKALEMGLILSPAVFIVSLASIAIGEAFEVNSTANTFLYALRRKKRLGKGDLLALLTVRDTLPRIALYYLLVGILFGVIGLTLPITFPCVLSVLSQVWGRIVEFTVTAGYPTFYLAPLSVAVSAFLVMLTAGKAKDRLLNLSAAANLHVNTLRDTFDVEKSVTSWTAHHEGIAFKDAPEPSEIQRNEDKKEG
jgi:hypothetical protein